MVGTLDAGMSMDVSSSGSPRECSDSMEGRLEVDGWEGWLSGGFFLLVSRTTTLLLLPFLATAITIISTYL